MRRAESPRQVDRELSFLRSDGKHMTETALKDRVAFITGAASGIGAALTVECDRLGSDIVLFDRRHQSLRQAAANVRVRGGQALVIRGDVTKARDLPRAVGAARRRFG